MNTLPILNFSRNEAYGPAIIGLDLWEIGSTGDTLHDVERSVIHDLKIWHHYDRAITIYRTHRITFNKIMIRGDAPQLNNRYTDPIGIDLSDFYRSRDYVISRADIQGQRIGIKLDFSGMPPDTVGKFFDRPSPQDGTFDTTIQKSELTNYTNLSIETRRNLGSPRRTVVCNTSFNGVDVDPNGQRSQPYDVIRSYNFGLDRNLISPDEVDIYNYNGISAADFAAFSAEQAPDFVVPQSVGNGRQIGSPVAGLTNQQNRAQHGVAVADEIAPCADLSSYPKVAGFTCPLDSGNGRTDVSRPTSPTLVRLDQRQVCRGEVILRWASSCDDRRVTSYVVSRDGADISRTSGTALTDTDLAAGTYTYRVRARDAAGNDSVPSTSVSVRIPANCPG